LVKADRFCSAAGNSTINGLRLVVWPIQKNCSDRVIAKMNQQIAAFAARDGGPSFAKATAGELETAAP
jgi:hypothetical protein